MGALAAQMSEMSSIKRLLITWYQVIDTIRTMGIVQKAN